MGKKFKKKKSKNCISPVKERNKIRDSILEVFKARLQSPSKGGALLVGESADDSPLLTDDIIPNSTKILTSDSSADISSDSSDSFMAKKKKVQCKRKLSKENSQKKSDNHLKKHRKQITDMTSAMPLANSSSERKISHITESRVTKCLGLFNRGRKSNKIERVPISMSESIRSKTHDDLKRVLNIKSTSDEDDSSKEEDEDDISYSNVSYKKSSPLTFVKSNSHKFSSTENLHHSKTIEKKSSMKPGHESQRLTNKLKKSSRNKYILPTVRYVTLLPTWTSSAAVSCVTVSSNISSCSEIKKNLPKQPPTKEIAMEMLSKLRPKRELFNRNIRQERSNELQRLLLQSLLCPDSGKCSEKTKPVAMISAKRSLLNSATLPAEVENSPVDSDNMKKTENDEPQCWNLHELNDAKSLLVQNDIQLNLESNLQSFAKFEDNSDDIPFVSSFKNCQNQSFVPGIPLPPDGDTHHIIDHSSITMNQDRTKLNAWKTLSHHTENRSSHIVLHDKPQFCETVSAVPSFSGDWVESMESCIKRKQIYHNEESQDLLEFLDPDRTTDTASFFWNSQRNTQTWNKKVFKDDNDPEYSPLWIQMANLPPSPSKPSLDSIPSPPERLYPRKLY